METLKRYKYSFSMLALVVIGVFGYLSYTQYGGFDFLSNKDDKVDGKHIGREIISQLNEVRDFNLDHSIVFEDEAFLGLQDYRQQIVRGALGRNNPFSSVGQDGAFTGTAVDINTIDINGN